MLAEKNAVRQHGSQLAVRLMESCWIDQKTLMRSHVRIFTRVAFNRTRVRITVFCETNRDASLR